MSSLARQGGKYCLVCHTQPWTDPTLLSPHAPSTVAGGHILSSAKPKIITQSDGEMEGKGQVHKCAVIVVNEPVPDQSSLVETLPWITTNLGCTSPPGTTALCSASRLVIMCAGL